MCLLQIMSVPVKSHKMGKINIFWDSGATVPLISKNKAIEHGFKGTPVTLRATTIGGIERNEDSYKYGIPLIDCEGKIRIIVAYGIEKITTEISNINTGHMNKLFNQGNMSQVRRPSGTVDLLIGFEYAAWHPIREQAAGHLLLLSNIFGKCMGGYHPRLNEQTEKHFWTFQ